MKQQLKQLASEITLMKSKRKGSPNGVVHGLCSAQYKFRHLHIAYCLLRGRSYEEIEQKVAEGNEPNWRYVDELKEKYNATQAIA